MIVDKNDYQSHFLMVNGEERISSLSVAAIFRKKHSLIVRTIQSLPVPTDYNLRYFMPVRCNVEKGRKRNVIYHISREGLDLLWLYLGKKLEQKK